MEGTKRFQDRHPNLDWEIHAGQYAGQLHMTVITPDAGMRPVPVLPTLDMADSVVTSLEQLFRKGSFVQRGSGATGEDRRGRMVVGQ